MNYFAPGLRELARILDRLGCRLDLVWQRRKLDRLEGRLGLLGWQQADYDSGTQHHVDRLAEYERTQVQLTNDSAALGLTLQQLEERRTSERETFERQRAERVAAQKPLVGPVEEGEKALAALRSERSKLEHLLSDIDRELADCEEKYRALLAKGEHDADEEKEVVRWQRRVLSIPQERQDWEHKLQELLESLPPLEAEVLQCHAMLSVEIEALRSLEKSFAESDGALAAEIAVEKREKQKLERQINELEKAKSRPYREIGKALADHRIEPLNQPEALAAVLAQRSRIAAHEAKIAASIEQSGVEKRDYVWGSWVLLLLTIAIIVCGVLWLAFQAG